MVSLWCLCGVSVVSRWSPLYTGAGLHLTCTQLSYRHPTTGQPMDIQVRPAKKMRRAIPGDFTPVATSKFTQLFEG